VGARRLQRDGDVALVAGITMPLFGSQLARPAIAEARAERAAVEAREQAARVRAEASLFELVQELQHAITETELLRDEVLPQMQEALQATEYAWQRGRYSYLEWTEAQAERVAVQRTLIEAAANAQIFQVEIERLTGAALQTDLIRHSAGEKP
jgi:cobalt-zinc-cadmium efflux system outer membrane protein